MIRKGFSLIELMVVIAIIGIVSIIAMPYLREYQARAKISSVIPVVDQLKTQAIAYYNQHGVFPDAAHLGLDSPQAVLNNPTALSQYLSSAYIISIAFNDEGYTCTSNFGEMLFYFDQDKTGIDANGFDFGVFVYYADVNGTLVSTAADSSTSGNEYVINMVNPNYPTRDDLFAAAGCVTI